MLLSLHINKDSTYVPNVVITTKSLRVDRHSTEWSHKMAKCSLRFALDEVQVPAAAPSRPHTDCQDDCYDQIAMLALVLGRSFAYVILLARAFGSVSEVCLPERRIQASRKRTHRRTRTASRQTGDRGETFFDLRQSSRTSLYESSTGRDGVSESLLCWSNALGACAW